MPAVFQGKKRRAIDVRPGANLMQALIDAGVPVASSCRGDGVCAKCRVHVLEGRERLTPPTPLELRLRERHRFAADERVACLTRVRGDVAVDADYW